MSLQMLEDLALALRHAHATTDFCFRTAEGEGRELGAVVVEHHITKMQRLLGALKRPPQPASDNTNHAN